MRALLGFAVTFGFFYLAFALGQVSMKRKYKDRRDPLPVIKAARAVIVSEGSLGVTSTGFEMDLNALKMALDDWDLKPQ